MPAPTRLFTYIPAPPETLDTLLLESIGPVVREIRDDPRLESVSFVRSGTPESLIRVLARGEAAWMAARVRPMLEERLGCFARASVVAESDFPEYLHEVARWGGEAGIALAERMFHHDTFACLERLDLESRRAAGRSRREWSLLMTDRLLDLLCFEREERLAFYRFGHAWPVERGEWGEEDLRLLELKYRTLRPGLGALMAGRGASDPASVWGSAEAAEVAERCLARLAPLIQAWIEARDHGRLAADWNYLVWSLAHVHALRLGIDPVPEAMLRFFMYRLLEDGDSVGA